MDCSVDKHLRILHINALLNSGRIVNPQILAVNFHVSKRTILRDLDDIKEYYENAIVWDMDYQVVNYDKKRQSYRLMKEANI